MSNVNVGTLILDLETYNIQDEVSNKQKFSKET